MIDLTAERAAYRAREKVRERVRMARVALNQVGWNAGAEELRGAVREKYERMEDEDIEAVVKAAAALQAEERAQVRHISPAQIQEESETMTEEQKEAVRKATEALLRESPKMNRHEMYEAVKAETGMTYKFGTWQTEYLYPIRRALKAEGVDVDGRTPKKKASAKERGRRPRPDAASTPLVTQEPVRVISDPQTEDTGRATPEAEDAPQTSISVRSGDNAYSAEQRRDGTWDVFMDLHGVSGEELHAILDNREVILRLLEATK